MRLQCFISLTVGFEITTTERQIQFDTCTKMSCFDVSINDDDILEKDEAVYVFINATNFNNPFLEILIVAFLKILIVDNENG